MQLESLLWQCPDSVSYTHLADFRNVAAEQKQEVGMRLNELKTKAQDKINALKEQFESQDNGCDGLDRCV